MHSSAYCIQIKNLFCAGFFVLLCSKHVSVIFYALDESEKNGQFVLWTWGCDLLKWSVKLKIENWLVALCGEYSLSMLMHYVVYEMLITESVI